MYLETVGAVLSGLKDIALGVAAVTTAVVAWKGLQKWRQELEGKAHFEVARNLIRSTYRLRNAVWDFRNPFYASHEFPSDYNSSFTRSADKEADGWRQVFRERAKPLQEAIQEFETFTLEAEALWGSVIRSKTESFQECLRELSAATLAFMDDKQSGGETFSADRDFAKKMRATVGAGRDDKENPLNVKMAAAISGIEGELLQHLRRK